MTVAERSPVGETDLEPTRVAGAVLGATLLGMYAAWIAADFLARPLTFLVVAGGAGYVLAGKPDARSQAVYGGYVLAGLLVLTPILMVLPDVLSGSTYGPGALGMALLVGNVLLFVLFAIPAVAVAYVAYRLDGGRGVLQRVRNVEAD